jgi:hypothetical protein
MIAAFSDMYACFYCAGQLNMWSLAWAKYATAQYVLNKLNRAERERELLNCFCAKHSRPTVSAHIQQHK